MVLRAVLPKRNGGFTRIRTLADWPGVDQVMTGDVNGDGRTDIMAAEFDSSLEYKLVLYVAISEGDAFRPLPRIVTNIRSLTLQAYPGLASHSRWFVGDANGDLKSDFMIAEYDWLHTGSIEHPHARLITALAVDVEMTGNDEARFVTFAQDTDMSWGYAWEPQWTFDDPHWFVGDHNGDGRSDFIRVARHRPDDHRNILHAAFETAVSNGNGKFTIQKDDAPHVPWTEAIIRGGLSRVLPGDYDGDGGTDLLFLGIVEARSANARVGMWTALSRGSGEYDVVFHDTMGMFTEDPTRGLQPQFLSDWLLAHRDDPEPAPTYEPFVHPAAPIWLTGDFDGDGATDLMIGSPARFELPIWPTRLILTKLFSNRKGGFVDGGTSPTSWREDCSRRPNGSCDQDRSLAFDLIVGDVNGDGRDDSMYAGHDASNSSPLLAAKPSPNTTSDTHRWQEADVNGDGYPDLVYVYYADPGLRIYTSLGRGHNESRLELRQDIKDPRGSRGLRLSTTPTCSAGCSQT